MCFPGDFSNPAAYKNFARSSGFHPIKRAKITFLAITDKFIIQISAVNAIFLTSEASQRPKLRLTSSTQSSFSQVKSSTSFSIGWGS